VLQRQKGKKGGRGGEEARGGRHCAGRNARGTNAICRVTADSQSIRSRDALHNRCERMHDDCRITRVGIPT